MCILNVIIQSYFIYILWEYRVWNLQNFKNMNKPEAEISKRMIILKIIASSHGKTPNKTKKPALVIAKWSVLMTVRLTVHEIHIYSRQEKKWTKPALPSLTGLLPRVESSGWGTERQLFSSRAAERSRQAKIKMEDFLKHSKVLMLCFVLLCFDLS